MYYTVYIIMYLMSLKYNSLKINLPCTLFTLFLTFKYEKLYEPNEYSLGETEVQFTKSIEQLNSV